MRNIAIVNGPNLNLLGTREPEIYGKETLADINNALIDLANRMGLQARTYQSNHEGAIIDFIHEHSDWADGLIINPGAYTHYSYAIRDAIAAVELPAIEIHLSDIHKREEFRKISVIKDVCAKQISGFGWRGYLYAVEYLAGLEAVQKIEGVSNEGKDRKTVLTEAIQILKDTYPKYTWAGIYLVEGEELVLHNYIGKPSPHTRIPIGKGICGAAVAEEQTIIVADVNADPRYLACSIETKSEIVVPIRTSKGIAGEIDIDSDTPDAFHEFDSEILEMCAESIAKAF